MRQIRTKRGLDLPITGQPVQEIREELETREVAVLGTDYGGLKPRFQVEVGDTIRRGDILFLDKNRPEIVFTAPAPGKVKAINRGEKRSFLSIVIVREGKGEKTFSKHTTGALEKLARDTVAKQMLESGVWALLRTRPFGTIPDPADEPEAIFVKAMDTNPLAPDVRLILAERENDFINGLSILSRLTKGTVYVCQSSGKALLAPSNPAIEQVQFSGPHPAGNVGTHIHFLNPVHSGRSVWYIGAQDVCDLGYLFTEGRLNDTRVISLAGPSVKEPRLVRCSIGAGLDELTSGQLREGSHRIISGSVLSGSTASGPLAYLGRYEQQVSVIPEFTGLGFFAWMSPGFKRFSLKNIYLSRLIPGRRFDFDTALNGGPRAIVPINSYEKVMPLDILPNYLLRALAAGDIDESEKLGCLELEEEDLALCSFVCPSKIDHGANLRALLTKIEKEG